MCISLLSVSTSSVLSPTTWPFGLDWLPQSTYLVGGIVRDALLDRQSSQLDLDFVMPEGAVETARSIARHYKAGFVLLDEERQIARVVFDRATADFARQVGPTLEIDLQRRDFTVNAIAYNPHRGEIIDPLKGQVDLKRRLLRMICVENLEEDPLRLLRAYRQAAQLGFSLDPDTRIVIQRLAPLLNRIAAERVQAELSYLFSTPKGTPWLIEAWQDGLLQAWFPSTTPQSLKLLAAIEAADAVLSERCPALGVELSRWIREKPIHPSRSPESQTTVRENSLAKSGSCRRTWLATAKLASFFVAMPGRAEAELVRLKYSRAEIQAVITILKFLPQLHPEVSLSCREQYFL
ncbi:MAG: CCA tRNA nucleotidyltransferase, partial [Leptolyngbyaceae cyanobacterium bins.59]|nr:CCA tRNA nucleotidyltransferase [Leptolyngbyaceae cyanobacterium bins.59]